MRNAAKSWLILLASLAAGACHVFEGLEDCEDDSECAAGERCHPEEHFCQLDDGPVVIGALLPLSGGVASFGQSLSDTVAFSEAFIRDAGGLSGREVHIEIVDDQSDEDVAAAEMSAFADRRVAGVVGLFRSAQALRAQTVSHERQLVTITPAAGATALALAEPENDRYFFQTITSIRRGSASAITLFATRSGPPGKGPCCRMAVLHTDDVTGRDYRDSISALLAGQGGSVIASVEFPVEAKPSYEDEVSTLIQAQPECATLVASPKVGANIILEFNTRIAALSAAEQVPWQSFYWLGTTSLHSQAFLDEGLGFPTPPSEGVWGADVDPAPERLSYAKLQGAYNTFYGLAPETELPPLTANAHDAFAILLLAIALGGTPGDGTRTRDALSAVANAAPGDASFDSTELADALLAIGRGEPIDYNGASGAIELDARGVVGNGTVIWTVADNAFENVQRFTEHETAEAEIPSTSCPE